jgi:hypothetical protein
VSAIVKRLALGAVVAALVACAGAPAPSAPRHETERNEILLREQDIIQWRREAGLEPTPAPKWIQIFYDQPQKRITEPQASPPEVCRDVCNLADYICQAADDICRIADDLRDDDWARRKCASAKASCVEARGKCTQCGKQAAGGAPGRPAHAGP